VRARWSAFSRQTVGALGALALLVSGCSIAAEEPAHRAGSFGSPSDGQPTQWAAGREVLAVTSLADLVQSSDVVVVAEAIDVVEGPSIGDGDSVSIGYRLVTYEIETAIKGSVDARITVAELASVAGHATTLNGAAWSMPGDRMVLGLVRFQDVSTHGTGAVFRWASTVTRFQLLDGGDVVAPFLDETEVPPFASEAAALDETALISALRAAA